MAWDPLGWRPSFFAEIDDFPRAVLAHHYPNVPLHGDFTTIQEGDYDAIDLLVGGTPCQSFSIAGLRGGLDDDRGNLALEYLLLAQRLRAKWLVWENVPGVLSSNGGRDFGAILGGMFELGYGVAYRVLDAQYIRTRAFPWAVPQRRRRVFVVGYLGDWRRAAAVLFDRESLHRHPAPRRETGQGVAGTITASAGRGSADVDDVRDGRIHVAHPLRGEGFDASEDGTGRGTPIVPVANSGDVSHCLTASAQNSLDAETETLIAFDSKGSGVQFSEAGEAGEAPTLRSMSHAGSHQNAGGQLAIAIQERAVSENPDAGPDGAGVRSDGAAYTLEARENTQAVAFAENSQAQVRLCGGDGTVSSQLTTGGGKPGQGFPAVFTPWAVRRLTPVECERLQGFPDDFTNVPWRGKPGAPDGRRYKALGNSMAVNVMQLIGERIAAVEALGNEGLGDDT